MAPEHRTTPDSTSPTDATPLLMFAGDLYEHARRRAQESGATEPVEADLAALQRHARAMAKQAFAEAYDPARYPHDALREREHQKIVADREEGERTLKFAGATLREREHAAAKVALHEPKPAVHPVLVAGAVALVAATIAPTLHDLLAIDDPWIAWMFAFLSGVLAGGFITLAILGTDQAGHRSAVRWVGLLAGVLVGVGLGVIRLAAAEEAAEGALAIGLTIIEVGAVALLEHAARQLQPVLADWCQRRRVADEAAAECTAAAIERDRWKARGEALTSLINAHLAYVEKRSLRNRSSQDLEDASVRATVDGYASGLAFNRGRLLGATR